MLITISRQFGAGGSEVAAHIAKHLDWTVLDDELVEEIAARAGLSPEEAAGLEARTPSFVERLARSNAFPTPDMLLPAPEMIDEPEESKLARVTRQVVAELGRRDQLVLVGRSAAAILARASGALHVRLVGGLEFRIGVAIEHLVVDRAGAHEQRVTALGCRLQTEQTDNIGRVGVEGLSFRRLVDANGRVGRGGAGVPDMAEQVAGCVLAAGPAEVGADGHERRRGVRVGELGDRQARHESKPVAVGEGAPQLVERRLQRRQRHAGRVEHGNVVDGGAGPGCGDAYEFVDGGRIESDRPLCRIGEVGALPGGRRGEVGSGHGRTLSAVRRPGPGGFRR